MKENGNTGVAPVSVRPAAGWHSMNANFIEARAHILEVLSPRTYRAALPNGKRIFAFVPAKEPHLPIQVGADVLVRIAIADFSRGQILSASSATSSDLPALESTSPARRDSNPP